MIIIPPNLSFISTEITELLENKLVKTLINDFNVKGIYDLFEKLVSLNKVFFRTLLKEIFEELDEQIFLKERDKINQIPKSKRKRHIETIFGDVVFYRRYYFNKATKKYEFLLDKKLDIDSRERIHKQVKVLLFENLTGSMTAVDLIKTLKNANISQMTVSNILNKTDLTQLWKFLIEVDIKNKIVLKPTNVLYLQADDTFKTVRSKVKKTKKLKNGKTIKAKKWQTIRVLTVHTGHVEGRQHPKVAKKLENKRVFHFNTQDWSWQKALELCKKFYQMNDETKLFICGDGARWIKAGADELGGKFVMDKFHVIREYSRLLNHKNQIEHDNIINDVRKYFAAGDFEKLYQLTLELKLRNDLQHKMKKMNKIIKYITDNKSGIESYKDPLVLGASIEGDIFNYIKRHFGKRKSFNKAALNNILTIKTAIKNNINMLSYLKHEAKENNLQKIKEVINEKWKHKNITECPITEGELATSPNRYQHKIYPKTIW